MLIEELGLEQVRDTNVGRLTRSEIRRLNVACQLLLDMAVLILDQPTKEMDIFDTFFLVEYLRNWASTGRVVIMSLHPPTYEIFAMLTKVCRFFIIFIYILGTNDKVVINNYLYSL